VIRLSDYFPAVDYMGQMWEHAERRLGGDPDALDLVFVLGNMVTTEFLFERNRHPLQSATIELWFLSDPIGFLRGRPVLHRSGMPPDKGVMAHMSEVPPQSELDQLVLRGIYAGLAEGEA
jgi:hypothetical protein